MAFAGRAAPDRRRRAPGGNAGNQPGVGSSYGTQTPVGNDPPPREAAAHSVPKHLRAPLLRRPAARGSGPAASAPDRHDQSVSPPRKKDSLQTVEFGGAARRGERVSRRLFELKNAR